MPRDRRPISHFVAAAPAAIRPRIYCAYCNRALSEAEADGAREHRMSTREMGEWACGCLRRYQDGEGGENYE